MGLTVDGLGTAVPKETMEFRGEIHHASTISHRGRAPSCPCRARPRRGRVRQRELLRRAQPGDPQRDLLPAGAFPHHLGRHCPMCPVNQASGSRANAYFFLGFLHSLSWHPACTIFHVWRESSNHGPAVPTPAEGMMKPPNRTSGLTQKGIVRRAFLKEERSAPGHRDPRQRGASGRSRDQEHDAQRPDRRERGLL